LRVAAATAAAYALSGGLALLLAGPPAYAAPLFPAAGVALAATLVYGRPALLGVLLGTLVVNGSLGLLRSVGGVAGLLLPLLIALGVLLQAGLSAGLVRRHVSQPLVLDAPRDLLRFALLGGGLGCTVSASVAVLSMLALGALPPEAAVSTWATWWVGDTLGVMIGAPLALTLIGRPREDWRPRGRTLAVPLLAALALLAAALLELSRLDQQRVQAAFERDADRLAATAEARLAVPVYALQALHSSALVREPLDESTLTQSSGWWLAQQPSRLLAMGYSERVPLARLAAFEAAVRADGLADYRVFDRDGGSARAADGEVLAIRRITPVDGNRAALGLNTYSVPAARAAVEKARASGQPSVTHGFRLTQAEGDETGVVIYQALYSGSGGAALADEATRAARFRGVIFVTVPTERALAGLASAGQRYLHWCLVDTEPGTPRPRLAGPPGCESRATARAELGTVRPLALGGRVLELRIAAETLALRDERGATWMLLLVGLAAVSLLGALLLTVTGHTRRTERAVNSSTAELRREIHERAAAEAALRESEERLRSILDHVPLGVMFLDPQGHVIECNPRFAAMVGSTPARLRGAAVADHVHPDDLPRVQGLRRELLAGGGTCMLESLRLRRGNGQEMQVRVSANALRSPEGRMLRLVGVVEDITEHLRLLDSERALQRAEAANRAKSEFLSRMSHELRTPLNAMIGFAQLLGLSREPGLAPQQREWAQQIQRAGWHLLEMINETLDLARIESGAVKLETAPLALAPLVTACRAMVATPAAQRGILIEETLDAQAGAVLADAMRVRQVLTNLLSNAVKYNVDGGRVSVTTRRRSQPGGDVIEIAVADTGLGMTAEQQTALFQPYNRLGRENTGIEGTGIGLVISRRLAELMNGTLEASSEAGRGSIFTLSLPAAAAAELPPAVYSHSAPAPYQQRLVHYVEDNETNIEVMRGVLAQRAQIELKTSQLGLDGLSAIRAQRPDLILLDMQLPDISGLELLRHLKQDDAIADIPVVVVSADATLASTQQALTSGAAHYVTKPLDVAQFLQIIDAILESADTRWG
jgi:PAS domain S-box-containing protein